METQTQDQTNQVQKVQEILNFGNFKVFSIIKKSHTNYGIKNSDYLRYRKYCSSKILKLRKSLNYKYGTKTKFIKKDILKDNQNDKKTLDISLYNSQKYWAEANQTKFSPYRNPAHKARARFVSIKKLKKAINWSNKLCKITQQRTSYLSNLQANAYKFYLQGMLLFEQQKWSQAQSKLIAARQIMDQLLKSSTSTNDQILKQKIDQFEQTIKFCNFKISKGKDMTISQIIEMKKVGDPNLSNLIQSITQQRLNEISLYEGHQKNQIRFENQKYIVKHDKIIVQKSKIDNELKSLHQLKKKCLSSLEDQQIYEELLLFYSNVVVLIEQAIKITDLERESNKKGDKYNQLELQTLKKISLLFQYQKISLFIERSYVIFSHGYNTNGRKSSPQTLAKLLTTINNNLLQITEIVKAKNDLSSTSSTEQIKSIDEKAFYFRTLRLFFVGLVYFNNDKLNEAYGLWNQCEKAIQILHSKEQMKNEKQKLQQAKDPLAERLVPIQKIRDQVKQYKLKTVIKNYLNDSSQKKELTKMVDEINIKSQTIESNKTLQGLIESEQQAANLSLQKLSSMQIIKLPGNLQPVPPRPIFFDIYQTEIQYPSLQGKAKKNNKGGWKGWFGGLLK